MDTCHEAVIIAGFEEPCESPAVGWRIDLEDADPYPVCRRHWRAPFATPLADLLGMRPDLAGIGLLDTALLARWAA